MLFGLSSLYKTFRIAFRDDAITYLTAGADFNSVSD